MRRLLVIGLGALVLSGCGDTVSPADKKQQDDRAVAMVQAANDEMPPIELVTPDPIQLPDIERFDLYGQACSFAPGTSLGTRVFAREADAFMKIKGDVQRLAADPGARELPMRTRGLYSGTNYSLRLQIEGEGKGPGNYEGSVTLFDKYNRVVYEGTGLAQCKDG
ncbi:MAG: hypothetical protein ABIT16_03195 [Croceibacterium sp.]